MKSTSPSIPTSITPWITVRDGERALSFYREAFGAKVVYRLEDPHAGVVARLSVNGAQFWISDGAETAQVPECASGGTVRMILTVADPEAVFAQAIRAGAKEIFPVGVQHGWRIGRLADPFGLHWEIGHMIHE
jgi:PhnB protein